MVRTTPLLLLFATIFLISAVAAVGNPFGGGDDCEEDKPKCPPGYKLTQRKNNRFWCLKYFPGNYTFFEAERICRCQGGGSLSGIENMNELNLVLKEAKTSFESIGIKNGGVWVGAYRRQDCMGELKKWVNKTECDKLHQFQWTDRFTIGTELWQRWMEGSPHNNFIGNHAENCVQLQVSDEAAGTANKKNDGTFDNKVCVDHGTNGTFPTEGFICGRPPKGGNGGYYGGGGGGDMIFIGDGKPTGAPKKA